MACSSVITDPLTAILRPRPTVWGGGSWASCVIMVGANFKPVDGACSYNGQQIIKVTMITIKCYWRNEFSEAEKVWTIHT